MQISPCHKTGAFSFCIVFDILLKNTLQFLYKYFYETHFQQNYLEMGCVVFSSSSSNTSSINISIGVVSSSGG